MTNADNQPLDEHYWAISRSSLPLHVINIIEKSFIYQIDSHQWTLLPCWLQSMNFIMQSFIRQLDLSGPFINMA